MDDRLLNGKGVDVRAVGEVADPAHDAIGDLGRAVSEHDHDVRQHQLTHQRHGAGVEARDPEHESRGRGRERQRDALAVQEQERADRVVEAEMDEPVQHAAGRGDRERVGPGRMVAWISMSAAIAASTTDRLRASRPAAPSTSVAP